MDKKVITRFAPSPTGFMHIGGVRTALFAYLWARKNKGGFILRIEDTDKEREVPGSIQHIQESLQWLNIDWDYGPEKPGPFGSCIQSERLDGYLKYAQKLIDKGLAYADPYTAEEIKSFRDRATAEKKPYLYRDHRPENPPIWDGSTPLRLKVPEIKRYTWNDEVRGSLSAGPEMLDDIVIVKSDGYPTYNFAHIVDDIEMGVTHIMRADEFIASTPKFLSIYDALEVPYPTLVSLPPIMNDTGNKKLSKRDGAKDILEYRTEGYLPQTMINFLALVGWNPGGEKEVFSRSELIEAFSLRGIQRSGGAFDPQKLLWMNREHLALLDDETYISEIKNYLPDVVTNSPNYTERLERLLPNLRERINIYSEAGTEEYHWVFLPITYDTELLRWKNDDAVAAVRPRLQHTLTLLKETDFGSYETLKASLWDYAEEVGKGELLWPLRVALTGLERSPDPFQCAYILGKEETLIRIQAACDKIS